MPKILAIMLGKLCRSSFELGDDKEWYNMSGKRALKRPVIGEGYS